MDASYRILLKPVACVGERNMPTQPHGQILDREAHAVRRQMGWGLSDTPLRDHTRWALVSIAGDVLAKIRRHDLPATSKEAQSYHAYVLTYRRLQLSLILDELDWRGLLPSKDDLCVIWDQAQAKGLVSDPIFRGFSSTGPWCLLDLWLRYGDKFGPIRKDNKNDREEI
jgi:hypothetical protein